MHRSQTVITQESRDSHTWRREDGLLVEERVGLRGNRPSRMCVQVRRCGGGGVARMVRQVHVRLAEGWQGLKARFQ